MYFSDFKLKPQLQHAIESLGYEKPTLIQEMGIPKALEGKDIVGQSQTGTGKTAAFLIPIIQKVRRGYGPQAVIITPTRELCVQITEFGQKLGKSSKIKTKPVYGGVGYANQRKALKNDEIIVATPGRLLDHLGRGDADFSKIRFFVIDEADLMLEMGFIDDVKKIISYLPVSRQNFLFSATFPSEIMSIIEKTLDDPVYLETEQFVDETKLIQTYYSVDSKLKFSLLLHILEKTERDLTALIFCATRNETDVVYKNLKKHGYRVLPIHGGYSQAKRMLSIEKLHRQDVNIVVATDVAARGLDIRNINHIINWDIPQTPIDYIHRIGRTARAGDVGYAISFVCRIDQRNFKHILELTENAIVKVHRPHLNLTEIERKGGMSSDSKRKGDKRRTDPKAVFHQKKDSNSPRKISSLKKRRKRKQAQGPANRKRKTKKY